ncbi:uncharacterized protein LOC122316174 [Carya illinoinensis]|uniref:uncharacterized protein LOC122316174 n=1 Tax=Carya illinoinensis TaxID=32201 RepID=UPI001C7225DC|nr:uncharacterized protein LOC122316174 [Carya illinoinensis]
MGENLLRYRWIIGLNGLPPPPPDFYKANWDAAVDKENSKIGVGVIIRDSGGLIIASLYSSISLSHDSLLGEAVAALRATSLCSELGLQQIMLEGDSIAVGQAVQHKDESWSPTGLVIRDIKLLLSKVRTWSIHHIPRKFNVIVHALAKFALTSSEEHIFMEDYPPCIQHLL